MILDNNTTNTIDPRQQALDALDRIEQIADDAQRWRAIQQFMFKLHPELVAEDQVHIATVKDVRMSQRAQTGSTKSGSMRQLYSMPEYLYRALQMADPHFQKMQESKDRQTVKKFNHKIWKVFPEYRIAEVI